MCRLLEVSRTGYLQWRMRPPSDRARPMRRSMRKWRRFTPSSAKLRSSAHRARACASRVLPSAMSGCGNSLLRQALRPVYRKPYRVTTDSAHHEAGGGERPGSSLRWLAASIAPGLPTSPTFATDEGWLYLACVLDLGSRTSRRLVDE